MPQTTQAERIVALLRENAPRPMTARDIAEALIEKHPERYRRKADTERFGGSLAALIPQLTAEVGAHKARYKQLDAQVDWRDRPRPRLYWWGDAPEAEAHDDEDLTGEPGSDAVEEGLSDDEEDTRAPSTGSDTPLEADLYPLLMDFLETEVGLRCMRVDERRSRNNRGAGANHWLHPDIVAMEPTPNDWSPLVQSCLRHAGGTRARVHAFEVKRRLTKSNVRQCFFQAVSNSSWAHEAYLVAAVLEDAAVKELRMLSALHGVGVIALNHRNPSESDYLLPARPRLELDWESVNRLVEENEDFQEFIECVENYLQTGRLVAFRRHARNR